MSRGCLVPVGADLATRCAVLLGASPPHTTVVGVTAARMHGLWLPERDDDGRIELAVYEPGCEPRQMNRPQRDAVAIRRRTIRPDEIVLLDSLPVTSPARTWRDLAEHLSLEDVVALGDSVIRSGVSAVQLQTMCVRMRGRRGARRATAALALLDGRSRSRPESHLRVALALAGLQMFEVNVAVHDDVGGWLAEPDLSCVAAKLALEYQGEHHADLKQMRADITRAADLRAAGWMVLMYGPAQVFGRPRLIAPEVRHLLVQRAPHLLAAATG